MSAKTTSPPNDSNSFLSARGDELPDDPRLLQAVQEYLERLEQGQRPPRRDFLLRYSEIAEPLARCLDGLDLVHQAAPVGPASRAGLEVPLGSRHLPGADATEDPARRVEAPTPLGARRLPETEIFHGDANRVELPTPLDSRQLPGEPLGDFQIVREIGRGGMGIVYEAVQLSLGRRVALKVLPFAAAFDAKQLQRFHNEAQAAARLHHTNIVPVYAVGSERGVHFYAMQLIEGQSLAVVVRQLRQQAGRGPADDEARNVDTVSPLSKALSTRHSNKEREFFRAAARFVVQAAEALEHAHQFGIVHRDIKPANLLVDVHGRLWITDFGLAQFHADAGLTQTGDLLGTLRYMSPEQASGQRVLLDHRTDVYSLGATLYEFITLEPIFPGQNRQELLHQIINEEPRPPRSLERSVPVELETILLKAVSKSPADRYPSARALAEDLQRYLEDKPILARRPSLLERARKWSRRHPSIVAASMVVLLLCLAGLVVNNRMIAEEKTRTMKALEGEQERAAEAEKRFRQALQAVNLLMQVCEDELADAPPHLQGARKRMMEMALAYYQDFIAEQQGNAALQAELADGRNRARRILDDLSTLQGAYQQMLVNHTVVQNDLKLSASQRKQIDGLAGTWTGMRPPPPFGDRPDAPADGPRKFLERARENEKQLGGILTANQRERLRQIALQTQGLMVFHEPRVLDALRLTGEQKQEIRALESSVFKCMRPGPHPHDHRVDWRKQMEEAQRDAMKRAVALFSLEQKEIWHRLTGEPLEGSIFDPPPRPR